MSAAKDDATNQALFREVNEQIARLGTSPEAGGHGSYICECGDPQCAESMALTHDEYEAVRGHANRFAVLPDHETASTEAVVEEHRGFSVVETFADEATRIAHETNPRSHENTRARGRESAERADEYA